MSKNTLDSQKKHGTEIKFMFFVLIGHFATIGLFFSEHRLPDIIEFLIVCILYCLWIIFWIFVYKNPEIIKELKTKIINLFYW